MEHNFFISFHQNKKIFLIKILNISNIIFYLFANFFNHLLIKLKLNCFAKSQNITFAS